MLLQYIYDYIKTPMFVLNSLYDTAQINGIEKIPCLPPNCTTKMMERIEQFHQEFLQMIKPVLSSPNGFYFDSCMIHCQTLTDEPWNWFITKGHTMRESFADWFYERPSPANATRILDGDWPNHTCA